MSSRLGSKVSRIEKAAGGRRYARESLASVEALSAFDTIAVLERFERESAALDPAAWPAECRTLLRNKIDRVILADVALASGNAGLLSTVYRNALEEWHQRDERMVVNLCMQALAADGLADWDSEKREWVGPGEGDPTGESELEAERRWKRAYEAIRQWRSIDAIDRMIKKAFSATDLTEQKRRESAQNAGWEDIAKKFDALFKARREACDDQDDE